MTDTQFTNEELILLLNTVGGKLGALFSSRLARKSNNDWDEFEEELYWEEFKKIQPLWEKLHTLVND